MSSCSPCRQASFSGTSAAVLVNSSAMWPARAMGLAEGSGVVLIRVLLTGLSPRAGRELFASPYGPCARGDRWRCSADTDAPRDAAGRVGHAGAGRDDVVPPAHLDHGAV